MNPGSPRHKQQVLIRIVVIDNQAYWRGFVADTLREAGYNVQTFERNDATLQALIDARQGDLIVLGCTSVTLEERLFIQRLLTQHYRLVVFATSLSVQMIRALFLQGVEDALDKTFDQATLLSMIEQAVERSAQRKRVQFQVEKEG